jgi:CubicO group peptidase (beta-lactamase class C family)
MNLIIHRTVTVILFPLIFSYSASAQRTSPVDWNQVDSLFAQWDKHGSPGCALGIFANGEIVYTRGYGEANLDHNIPITPETVFYVGSVSKQFAAAAVAILVDRGVIDLDDDIREYIPEMPVYESPVRIYNIVHHTSGIRDLYALMNLAEVDVADILSVEDKLRLISSQRDLNFLPGEEFLYSNSGYTLIAVLVERVTGKSFREFTNDNIFEPLGMNTTHFHDNRYEIINKRALSYQVSEGGTFYQSYLTNFEGVGPGGLYTTIGDLFLWDQNLYRNRIPNAPNLNEIMQSRGVLNNGDTLQYAFALEFGEYKGIQTLGHGGSFMGFRAGYQRFPEYNVSVGILCNLGSINPGPIILQFADMYFAEIINEKLSEYEGNYVNTELDVTYGIAVKDGNLQLLRSMSPKGKMEYRDKDTFSIGGTTIEFFRDEYKSVAGFTVDMGRARNVIFRRHD